MDHNPIIPHLDTLSTIIFKKESVDLVPDSGYNYYIETQ
jgi:hypothetical protein